MMCIMLRQSLVLIVLIKFHVATGQGLAAGSELTCENEGELVVVPGISDDSCITCVCENKEVKCSRKACPSLDGCYAILFDGPSGSCCDVCQGCRYNNKTYSTGDSWADPTDKCSTFTCRAGTLTKSETQCYTPCDNPVQVAGQCCPSCSGCQFEGKTYKTGDVFASKKDPCLQCKCQGGSVTCSKPSCPVLNCPANSIYTPKGQCCPTCKGMRKVYALPSGLCLFRKRVYGSGKTIRPDKCTKCVCEKGTVVCERDNCPVLACPESEAIQLPGTCGCKKCPEIPKLNCTSGSKTYKHGKRWSVDICTECRCDDGALRCRVKECNNALGCPKGYKMKFTPGVCCPQCVEADAVCTVFGDPHYRTFDHKIYNFQGSCKYLLAEDCVGKMFSIRVRNSARRSNHFAWTQMITIDVDNRRISLHQYLDVKVDRKSVSIPHTDPRLFSIGQRGHSVVVKLNMGVELTWDGDSFLEVKVSSAFKNRMCGLCGNYNGMAADDFTGKDGERYANAEMFGKTWRVGSSSACDKKPALQKMDSPCKKDFRKRLAAHLKCDILRQSMFHECRKKINVAPYFKSCMTDVCDCPDNKQCMCEVVTAYARACEREGVHVDWKHKLPQCDVPTCPKGAVYDKCVSACTKTCENRGDKTPCWKPCVPGCKCPKNKVLHKNKCIRPKRCPS